MAPVIDRLAEKKISMREKFPEGPPSWRELPTDLQGHVDLAKLKIQIRKAGAVRPVTSPVIPGRATTVKARISDRLEAAWEKREAAEEQFVEKARKSYTEAFSKDRKWKRVVAESPLLQQRVDRQKQWSEIFVASAFSLKIFARVKIVREENKQLSKFDDVRRKYLARTTEQERAKAWNTWKFVLNVFCMQRRLARIRIRNNAVFVIHSFLVQAIKLGELKRNCYRLVSRVKKMQRLCRNFARLKKLGVELMLLDWRKHEESILKKYYQIKYKSQASAAVTSRLWRAKRMQEDAVRAILAAIYSKRARRFSVEKKRWEKGVKEHLRYELDVRRFVQTLHKDASSGRPQLFDQAPNRKFWELSEREWKDLIEEHSQLDEPTDLT